MLNDERARGVRQFAGSVGRPVVDNDDVVSRALEVSDHPPDHRCFIVSSNNHRYVRTRCGFHHSPNNQTGHSENRHQVAVATVDTVASETYGEQTGLILRSMKMPSEV